MRLFVGLPLDQEARRGVEKAVEKLKRGRWPVRWVEPANWHVTVAFLAPRSLDEVGQIAKAVEEGCQNIQPFTVRFKGLGSWPDLLLPKVVWVGLKGDLKSLYRLVKQVRMELKQAGIEFDEKTFQPHLTLGRIKQSMGRKQRLELGKIINKWRSLDIPQKWQVDKVGVYESRLTVIGPNYRIEFLYDLLMGLRQPKEMTGESLV